MKIAKLKCFTTLLVYDIIGDKQVFHV